MAANSPSQLEPPIMSAPNIGFEGWELEQFLMESVQPMTSSHNTPPENTLCDVTFITELMECDFQQHDEPLHENQRSHSPADPTSREEHTNSLSNQIMGVAPVPNTDQSTGLTAPNFDQFVGLTPCSSASESEDDLLKFPHHLDITIEGFSAVASEEGLINHPVTQEVLHEDPEKSSEIKQMINLKLLHLLLACAEAVSEDNLELASVILSRLQELSSENGSHLQRLAVYISEALEARIIPSAFTGFLRRLKTPLPQSDMLEAFCVFYNVNPIGKFCHLTLNQLILDTTISDTQVHLVDLHIGYGMQWAAFLQAVALRPNGPPKLRLTAIGPSNEPLMSTGRKLMEMARNLQVPFEYCPIAMQLQSFDVGMLDVRQEEICVISSLGQLHTLLHKGGEFVDGFVEGLKAIQPKVFVLAENDADHNNPLFLNRFVECLKYYAAVFDSLDAALPPTSQSRLKLERLLAGRKIGSIIACEGLERVERHETMLDWMKRLEKAGFKNAQLTPTAINQAKLLLNLYYPNGYSLTEEHGALTLRWNGTALMAIGAWR